MDAAAQQKNQKQQAWQSYNTLAAVHAMLLEPSSLYEHPHGGNNLACKHLLSIPVPLLSPCSAGAVLPAPLRSRSNAASLLRVGAAVVLQPCSCGIR